MVKAVLNKELVEYNNRNGLFLYNVIQDYDNLMFYLTVNGGDGAPYTGGRDGDETTRGLAVWEFDGHRYYPFDKKDWEWYDKLRNEVINKYLFYGKK